MSELHLRIPFDFYWAGLSLHRYMYIYKENRETWDVFSFRHCLTLSRSLKEWDRICRQCWKKMTIDNFTETLVKMFRAHDVSVRLWRLNRLHHSVRYKSNRRRRCHQTARSPTAVKPSRRSRRPVIFKTINDAEFITIHCRRYLPWTLGSRGIRMAFLRSLQKKRDSSFTFSSLSWLFAPSLSF